MKEMAIKTGTFVMALLVLFSTLSFNVNKHYCAGEIASVSYFLHSDGCGMEEEETFCDQDLESDHVEKKSCCSTETDFVNGSDFLQKEIKTPSYISSFELFNFPLEEYTFTEGKFKEKPQLKLYSPPLLKIDKVVLYETYLI